MEDLEVQEFNNGKYYIEFPEQYKHLNRSFDTYDAYKNFINTIYDNVIYNNVNPPIEKITGKFENTILDVVYLNNNTHVYVLAKEWKTIPEHSFEVIKVFKAKDDAIDELSNLYAEDLEWVKEICNCKESELDKNELTDSYSLVSKGNIFCMNTIQRRTLIYHSNN